MLIISRALQGIGAALIAPNALALIATTFPIGAARNKAIGVYGAMSALGITLGVLLGGVLTGLLSWRWVFFINIPIGLAVLAGTRTLVEGSRSVEKLDTSGAITGTGALFALVFGLTRAGEQGWSDSITVGALSAAAGLMLLFVWLQRRGKDPMLPLSLFSDRNRSGSYAAMLFAGAGLMGTFYLLTLYLQQVLHFTPLNTGLAALPFSAGIVLGAGVSSKLLERLAPRSVAGPGAFIGAAGMLWLSRLGTDSSYWAHILPAVLATSFGLAMLAVTMTLTAVHGVAPQRAGVASALVNMAQQIGAALGLAILTTVSITAASSQIAGASGAFGHAPAGDIPGVLTVEALTHGYTSAFLAGSGLLVLAGAIVFSAVNTRRTQNSPAELPEVTPAPRE